MDTKSCKKTPVFKKNHPENTKIPDAFASGIGGGRWIRTTEGIASRFTVCPLWPLGNSPIFCSLLKEVGAGRRTRTPDLLITKIEKPVQTLLFQRFRTGLLINSKNQRVTGPLCPHGFPPVWVSVWVRILSQSAGGGHDLCRFYLQALQRGRGNVYIKTGRSDYNL